jgi:uncharacterized repeat protein (TIGR03943 family)
MRATRAAAVGVWALFFAWLWLSGEAARYLGPRTRWVVVFGAFALAGALAAQLARLRYGSGSPSRRDVAGLAVLIAPVLAVVVVPEPQLGALAASKKATTQGAIALGSLAVPGPEPGEVISFAEIHQASRSQSYANAAGVADGTKVRLTGFVTPVDDGSDGTFGLTRFYVSCCAADAVPFSVTVTAPGPAPPDDTWLDVAGTLSLRGGEYVVVAETMQRRSEPADPYLFF